MMLIRSSLPSSNPVTLPDTVHLFFEAESKIEKIMKIRKITSQNKKNNICEICANMYTRTNELPNQRC